MCLEQKPGNAACTFWQVGARGSHRVDGPSVLLLGVNPMSKDGTRGRDAGTGRFIPVQEAQRRKKTAVVETFKKDKNGRPRN